MANTRTINGEIVLPAKGVPAQTAAVSVYVEDVSRADAPSVVIGEQRQKGLSLKPELVIPVAVEVPEDLIDERHSYSVRVHIDTSGSDDVKVGDFVSTVSYPVLTRGYGTTVRITVKRV